jgi:hypothetical protein
MKKDLPILRHILQSNRAIDTTVWKQDMEFVLIKFEASEKVSHQGRLAYGRHDTDETSGWYSDIHKLGISS